jgi:uncharacterized delta-60 repeat protein
LRFITDMEAVQGMVNLIKICIIATCLTVTSAYGVPGALLQVATNSQSGTGFNTGMALLTDGKIMVAQGVNYPASNQPLLSLTRYNADGSLDGVFGTDGVVQIIMAQSPIIIYTAAPQSDGRLLVAGESGGHAFIARCNSDGSMDSSFHGNGSLIITETGFHSARGICVQPDGRIAVAIEYADGSNAHWLTVMRYESNGVIDSTFGGQGTGTIRVRTAFFAAFDSYSRALVLQPDGKIVLAGYGWVHFQSGNTYDIEVTRFNADGTWDTAFGGGVVSTDMGESDDRGYSAVLQSDGKILVGGSGGQGFALARYNSDGSLDSTLNGTGKVSVAMGGGSLDAASSIALQADGKIVLGGWAKVGATYKFALARLNSNGSLDTSFNDTGTQKSSIGDSNAYAYGMVMTSNGDFMVAGNATVSGVNVTALARFSGGTLSALESWRKSYFSTGQDVGDAADVADPYHTGVPNLLSYAFALDPRTARTTFLPKPNFANGTCSINFSQPVAVIGVTFGAEWSVTMNPGDWHSLPDLGTSSQHVFTLPIESMPRVFVRLKVTSP